ncbi:hypothetical protein COB57_03855 [Candidatus Peregrinibacteria bacterium]|nr:MAG: hypothetical protein COB57_03855 [Candidatus Peregrinibacteria bacterium]
MQTQYGGFWKRFFAFIIDGIVTGAITMIILTILLFAKAAMNVSASTTPEETIAPAPSSIELTTESVEAMTDSEIMQMLAAEGVNLEGKNESMAPAGIAIAFAILMFLVQVLVPYIYYAKMESSENQATLGKMALGMKVTDMNGKRISFGRASGRYWGKILSGLTILIGYIMAGFTDKKQALHDMMAGCLVVNK